MREGQGCGNPAEPSPNYREIKEGSLEEVTYALKLGVVSRILPGEMAGEGHSRLKMTGAEAQWCRLHGV